MAIFRVRSERGEERRDRRRTQVSDRPDRREANRTRTRPVHRNRCETVECFNAARGCEERLEHSDRARGNQRLRLIERRQRRIEGAQVANAFERVERGDARIAA